MLVGNTWASNTLFMPRGRPSTKQTASAFGERLRTLRRDRGFTQDALAKALGITQKTVSAYEGGTTWPSPPVMIRMAKTLQVTADELLGIQDIKTPKMSTSTSRLWTRFKRLQTLPPVEQRTVWQIIDRFCGTHRENGADEDEG